MIKFKRRELNNDHRMVHGVHLGEWEKQGGQTGKKREMTFLFSHFVLDSVSMHIDKLKTFTFCFRHLCDLYILLLYTKYM